MQQWTFNFGATPEQVEAQRRARIAQIQRLIDEQRCIVCENTYLINDQITMCSIKNECVDNDYGKYCDNWKPIDNEVQKTE